MLQKIKSCLYLTSALLILSSYSPFQKTAPQCYPWDRGHEGTLPPITKEHFRCMGCELNEVRVIYKEGKLVDHYLDCGGFCSHSLPLRDGEEFVYPILIEILNAIQEKFNQPVVITSGHRCPDHHLYVDVEKKHTASKHMVAGEVDFYVQGYENEPEKVVEEIIAYYDKYPEMGTFNRYQGRTDVATLPWQNKEIFIKIYKPDEGRNHDNRHPYSYISIQVKFDRDLKETVQVHWTKVKSNYLRY